MGIRNAITGAAGASFMSSYLVVFPSPCGEMGIRNALEPTTGKGFNVYIFVSVPLRGNGYKEPRGFPKHALGRQGVSVPLRGNGYKELGISLLM